MDIYFDKTFLDSLPDRVFDVIDYKLERISQYSFVQFRKLASCRKIKAAKDIFKFRFNDGDRIVFKYVMKGIRLICYASHDKQIKVALNYNKIRDFLTDGLIKWYDNAIHILLLGGKADGLVDNITEPAKPKKTIYNYVAKKIASYTTKEDESSIINDDTTEYIEDEIDDEIEKTIFQMVKDGIVNDDLKDSISDNFLENNDLENALKFEEIINIYSQRELLKEHENDLSEIIIEHEDNEIITEEDIKKTLRVFYKHNYEMAPVFTVHLLNTGYMKTLCLLTSNKDHSLNVEKIGELIANEVGKVRSTSILISMILTKSDHLDDKGKIFPISIRYYPHKKRMEVYEKPKNPFNSFIMANKQIPISKESDPYTDNNAGKYITGKQYIDARENVYESNLSFIFS